MKYFQIGTIALLLMSGCAQQKVVLKNKEEPFKEFSAKSSVSAATLPIKIASVTDAREKGSAIGEALTGARYLKTPVYGSENPEVFVKGYLEEALRNREFLLVDNDEKVELNIVIKELWVEEVIEKYQPERAKCRISLEVNAQRESASYTGGFWSEIVSPGDLGDATEKLGPSLASCMNTLVEKIVADEKFASFIKAKPLF